VSVARAKFVPRDAGSRVDRGVAFYVDGTTIPEVDWDVGPSWAGLLPISGDENETRKVNASRAVLLNDFTRRR